MKVIDLLNKIANGEEVPKKLYYEELLWEWNGETYDDGKQCLFEDYIDKRYVITDILNDEVEIIEEKKEIEKLKRVNGSDLVDLQKNSSLIEQNKAVSNLVMYLNMNVVKINELIDEIKKLKEQIK